MLPVWKEVWKERKRGRERRKKKWRGGGTEMSRCLIQVWPNLPSFRKSDYGQEKAQVRETESERGLFPCKEHEEGKSSIKEGKRRPERERVQSELKGNGMSIAFCSSFILSFFSLSSFLGLVTICSFFGTNHSFILPCQYTSFLLLSPDCPCRVGGPSSVSPGKHQVLITSVSLRWLGSDGKAMDWEEQSE